jgi:vancomycin permeability regulator SanA
MDAIAAMKISANRAVVASLTSGIISPQNIPLIVIVAAIIFLTEFLSRKKISNFHIFLSFITSVILLSCSFYLPSVGKSAEGPSILAYTVLMIQFATAMVVAFSKRPDIGRISGGIICVVAVLTLAGFLCTFAKVETFPTGSNSDAVVVLGASVWGKHTPSPILRGRLEEAVSIFNSGHAKKIVVTGGTKRFDTVESEVQAWYLRQRGVPDSSIISDRSTYSTCEQTEYVKRVLIDSLSMKNIVIVTDNWHLPRVLLMCRLEGAKVYGAASSYRMFFAKEIYSRLRESAALQAFILFGA